MTLQEVNQELGAAIVFVELNVHKSEGLMMRGILFSGPLGERGLRPGPGGGKNRLPCVSSQFSGSYIPYQKLLHSLAVIEGGCHE